MSNETRKRWRIKRRKAGLCTNCPNKRTTGCLCESCAEKLRIASNRRTAKRLRSGLCIRCGLESKIGSLCSSCLVAVRNHRKNRVSRGKCAYCKRDRIKGKTICRYCIRTRKRDRAIKIKAGLCSSPGCQQRARSGMTSCARCSQCTASITAGLKRLVLDHYGAKCACKCGCTSTNPRHLTIDHINNDGAHQRRIGRYNGGNANYRTIIKRGFPDDLQILCWNCNCAKQFYGGCK